MAMFDRFSWRQRFVTIAITAVCVGIPAPASAQEDSTTAETATPTLTLRGYLRGRDGGFARLDPPGSEATKPGDINNRGQVVGTGYADLDRPDEGFVYLRDRSGAYTVIDLPVDELRAAPYINDHGEIAGFFADADGTTFHGFFRDRRGRFTTIDHPEAAGSSPRGVSGTLIGSINNRGTVSGDYVDADGTSHCFLRDRRARLTTVDHPDADGTETPLGTGTGGCVVNDRGDIAGVYTADGVVHAFIRDPRGTYRDIDVPGAVVTLPTAVNNRGQIAGIYYVATSIDAPNGVNHGFLRDRRGRITTIDHPRATANGTTTYGLNDRGQTVGSYATASTPRRVISGHRAGKQGHGTTHSLPESQMRRQ
jgi:hypothetical protein